MARKPISKMLRFEVFKRDSFTCQYCGNMAPDVILEVDHINPVKNGGKNDILNLVTSCRACNSGKGARPLSENQILEQQKKQLKEINEKREQLKLLVEWKNELSKFDDEQIDVIDEIIQSISFRKLNSYGRSDILKTIKKYGISEVIESTKLSISQYFKSEDDISKVVSYIPKICGMRLKNSKNPMLSKMFYIRAIIRNRFKTCNDSRVMSALTDLVVDEEDFIRIKDIATSSQDWYGFWDTLNDTYEGEW